MDIEFVMFRVELLQIQEQDYVPKRLFIYSFDLTKKRMQKQGFEEGRKSLDCIFKCKGLTDCLKFINTEDFQNIFKDHPVA